MDQPTSPSTPVIDPPVYDVSGPPSFNTSVKPNILVIPTSGKIVLAILYSIVIIIAFGGNLLVIFIITATRRLRSVTNFFLASQGLSDALMSFVCVPWTFVANTLLDAWPFGEMCCKLASYVQASSVYLSAFTMLAISMDRYRAVMDPLKPRITKTTAGVVIASTWILALTISLPLGIYSRLTFNGPRASCVEDWPYPDLKVTYNYLIMLFQYLIPLAILTITYTRIAIAIWIRRTPGEAINDRDRRMETGKKKMIRMMITVVIIYAVCWLPLHVFTIAADHNPRIWGWRYIIILWTSCHLLAMSNICFNPIVYFLMNSKFREALKVIYSRWNGCCRDKSSTDRRTRHASGTSGRMEGRLVSGDRVQRSTMNPSGVNTRTSIMDKSKVAVRKFNGLPEMTWSSVTSAGFKDEICMTTLASSEQKINLQNTLENKMNLVENST